MSYQLLRWQQEEFFGTEVVLDPGAEGCLQSARAQVVQLAPNVRNRKVLRVLGKRGLPLKDATPLA